MTNAPIRRTWFRFWTIAAAALVGLGAAAKQAAVAAPQLQIVNGDYYSGSLADSEEPGVICWQSDAAVAPFRFDLASVSAAHFHRDGGAVPPTGAFCVELVGGDVLFGSLAGLSAESLALDTETFGKLHIARDQVQRLQTWGESSGIEYLGPDGLHGWKSVDAKGAWREEAGHPMTDKSGALALDTVEIPAHASIEVELSWQKKAAFSLQFGSGPVPEAPEASGVEDGAAQPNAPLRRVVIQQAVIGRAGRQPNQETQVIEQPPSAFELAVWGESLVLVREQDQDADLAALKSLVPGAGRLSLRLEFDQETGVVAAYTMEGKLVATVKAGAADKKRLIGIQLVNRSGDVRLERLMIRRSGGPPPVETDARKTHLQLRDGSVVAADGAVFDAAADEFVAGAGSNARRIPAAEVVCVTMPRVEAKTPFALRLSLHHGVRLNGSLRRVKDERLHFQRQGIAEPLIVPIDQLQSLVGLQHGEAVAAHAGRQGLLETAGTMSHGVIIEGESIAGGSCLHWLPRGSATSSPLRLDASGRIVYRAPTPQVNRPVVQRTVAARNRGVWGALVEAFDTPAPPDLGDDSKKFEQLLWLVAGDRIPCRVKSIDERGVTFETPILEATFAPHESIKAWDCRAGSQPRALDGVKFARLLTLPRMQRENPPTHIIESVAGDFLRGRLESMDQEFVRMAVRLESRQIPRSNVVRIIWLGEEPKGPAAAAPDDTADAAAADQDAEQADANEADSGESDEAPVERLRVQAVCNDGVRLTFDAEQFANGVLSGQSLWLGPCGVPIADVDQLYLGAAIAGAAQSLNYSEWRLTSAADPRYLTEDGQPAEGGSAGLESSLVGHEAPDFALELASGGQFRLSEQRGRIVVLDFWASWCGWCMQSMPELDQMAAEFGDQIIWVAVNLQEDRKTIAAALERLGIEPSVAMDIDGAAAEKFGVTAIPQTVVIDAEGKVTRVFIGGGPNAVDQIRTAIDETLAAAKDAPPAQAGE